MGGRRRKRIRIYPAGFMKAVSFLPLLKHVWYQNPAQSFTNKLYIVKIYF